MTRDERWALACLAVVAAGFALSAVAPRDRLVWVLEAAPVAFGATFLAIAHRRFPLTPLAQTLLVPYCLALCVGAHYTFAAVPPGDWVSDALGLGRNPYDRVVHFLGGFLPATFLREVLLRKTRLRPGRKLFWITTGLMLAAGAAYEIVEWATAGTFGTPAQKFLATQGDPWDSQWDMVLVLAGATLSHFVFRRLHDRQLAARGHKSGAAPEPAP